MNLLKFFKKLYFLRNKYILTSIFFVIWLFVFDQNNLVERIKNIREYNQLLRDKNYYIEKIEADRQQLKELKTNNENLEKFAREKYFMKKEDEDVFVILDEE
jgi:hypothetical protein